MPGSEKPDCTRDWVREGFYMRLVSGPAFVSMSGDGPNGHVSLSGLGSLATVTFGGSVARGVVLAGTLQASSLSAAKFKGGPFDGANVTFNGQTVPASSKAMAGVSGLGLLVDWYPNPSGGWHAGLSGGLGFASVVNQADDSTMFGASAAGSVFGGYDWAIGRQWSMGLALAASGSTPATMKDKDGTNAGYRLQSLSLGLGASILYF
jgi:hypothetical protein